MYLKRKNRVTFNCKIRELRNIMSGKYLDMQAIFVVGGRNFDEIYCESVLEKIAGVTNPSPHS